MAIANVAAVKSDQPTNKAGADIAHYIAGCTGVADGTKLIFTNQSADARHHAASSHFTRSGALIYRSIIQPHQTANTTYEISKRVPRVTAFNVRAIARLYRSASIAKTNSASVISN